MALRHRLLGRLAKLWWRMRRPRTLGVRAIILDPADRIALVRHTYLEHWYIPGGGVKKREGFAAGLARELREEVSIIEFAIERVLGIYHSRNEAKDDHVVVYVVRVADPTALAKADPIEIEAAEWFALDALPDDVSPATLRRIEEYRSGEVGGETW